MNGWIKHLMERWANWTGDKDMENAIRAHLTDHGYFGRMAKIEAVRLVAVQRPGWVQIYRFEATARIQQESDDNRPNPEASYAQLFGLAKEDARKQACEIRTFTDPDDRRGLFADWSDGLICLRGAHGLQV